MTCAPTSSTGILPVPERAGCPSYRFLCPVRENSAALWGDIKEAA
jgi:hypothetical protein